MAADMPSSWSNLLTRWRNRVAVHQPAGPFFRYEISDDPLEEDPAIYGLTPAEFKAILQISEKVNTKRPGRYVRQLEKLIEKYPQVPKLWNHLAIAYRSAGRLEDYERIAEETLLRFPDYLFGIVLLAMLRLDQRRPEEVTKILGGRIALHDLQHGRLHYHLSEVLAYYGLMVRYHLALGKRELAARYLDSLEQLAPDHPVTEQARSQMLLSLSDVMLGDD